MSEIVNLHLGRRLRFRRKSMSLTQGEVGAICGVTFQQVQKYESAASQMSAAMIWILSVGLEVDVRYFYDGLPPKAASAASKRSASEGLLSAPSP
jgi:transcriptional regulator with XRE-family HTH domain